MAEGTIWTDPARTGFRTWTTTVVADSAPIVELRLGRLREEPATWRAEVTAIHNLSRRPLLTRTIRTWYGTDVREVAESIAAKLGGDAELATVILDAIDHLTEAGIAHAQAEAGEARVMGKGTAPGDFEYEFAGRVPRGVIVNLFADGGSLKSTVADGLCLSTVTGIEVIPGFVPTALGETLRGALYLDWDTTFHEHDLRMRAMARAVGIDLPTNKGHPRILHRALVRPFADNLAEIGRMIEGEDVGLVVIDPAQAALRDHGTGDWARPVGELMDAFGSVSHGRVTGLLVDHVNKGGTQYGSTFKRNRARGSYEVTVQQRQAGYVELVLRNVKPLAIAPPLPDLGVSIRWTPAQPPYQEIEFDEAEVAMSAAEPAPDRAVRPSHVVEGRQLATWLGDRPTRDTWTVAELVDGLGMTRSAVARAIVTLNELRDIGLRLRKEQAGRWEPAVYHVEQVGPESGSDPEDESADGPETDR